LQKFLQELLMELEQTTAKQSVKWTIDVDPIDGI